MRRVLVLSEKETYGICFYCVTQHQIKLLIKRFLFLFGFSYSLDNMHNKMDEHTVAVHFTFVFALLTFANTADGKSLFFLVHFPRRRRRRLTRANGDSESGCLHFLKSLIYTDAFLTCACGDGDKDSLVYI